MFSFQYTFFNQANFFLSLLALLLFIRPMTSLTEYFGGMIIIERWTPEIGQSYKV